MVYWYCENFKFIRGSYGFTVRADWGNHYGEV